MSKRFWIASTLWAIAVVASTPLWVELLDRRGLAVLIPGLTVTASEIVLASMLALTPPLLIWSMRRLLHGRAPDA